MWRHCSFCVPRQGRCKKNISEFCQVLFLGDVLPIRFTRTRIDTHATHYRIQPKVTVCQYTYPSLTLLNIQRHQFTVLYKALTPSMPCLHSTAVAATQVRADSVFYQFIWPKNSYLSCVLLHSCFIAILLPFPDRYLHVCTHMWWYQTWQYSNLCVNYLHAVQC